MCACSGERVSKGIQLNGWHFREALNRFYWRHFIIIRPMHMHFIIARVVNSELIEPQELHRLRSDEHQLMN